MSQGIVVKIWNVKAGSNSRSASKQISDSIAYIENPEKLGRPLQLGNETQLGNELKYVMNELKTVEGLYVGCRHISDIKNATEEMMQVKRFFGKLDGRVATHGVISLDATESDSKNAGKLMLLLSDVMKDVFPDNQVVYAVHTNTENLHIHFIINTVGLNGVKIHMDKKFMREVLEPAVNKYAEKYGFTPNEIWKKERTKDSMTYPERKVFLRKKIDHAIEQTDDFDAFIAYLRHEGLTVNVGRHISLQNADMTKAIRTGSLGENYTVDAIRERLACKYNPFIRGKAGTYYEEIMPEAMAQITPRKMKKYKDVTAVEKAEAVRLLKLNRNPWQEAYHDNWQMQKMGDELKQLGYVYRLTRFYSNGTDNTADAMKEIVRRKKEIVAERKELRALLRKYKPITDIYEEMKKHMVKAYLYDVYGKEAYEEEFQMYQKLSERLKVSFGKDVEEVADFLAETKGEIAYLTGQEKELSAQYVAIKKYASSRDIQNLSDDYSFFHAIGHSQATYEAKEYGIYASNLKFIVAADNPDILIRVMTTPDMDGDKPTVTTSIAVLDKDGIVQKEASSKGKTTKEFNKDIYEIQSEYGIKKCEVTQKNIPKNARKI